MKVRRGLAMPNASTSLWEALVGPTDDLGACDTVEVELGRDDHTEDTVGATGCQELIDAYGAGTAMHHWRMLIA